MRDEEQKRVQIFCQQSMDEEDEEYNRTIVMTSEFRYGSLRNSEPVGTRLFLLRMPRTSIKN